MEQRREGETAAVLCEQHANIQAVVLLEYSLGRAHSPHDIIESILILDHIIALYSLVDQDPRKCPAQDPLQHHLRRRHSVRKGSADRFSQEINTSTLTITYTKRQLKITPVPVQATPSPSTVYTGLSSCFVVLQARESRPSCSHHRQSRGLRHQLNDRRKYNLGLQAYQPDSQFQFVRQPGLKNSMHS